MLNWNQRTAGNLLAFNVLTHHT